MNIRNKIILLLVLFIVVYGYAEELKFDNDDDGEVEWSNTQKSDYLGYSQCGFTSKQRWGTGVANFILPGLGSIIVMGDWTGAIVQWVLYGAGTILIEMSESGTERAIRMVEVYVISNIIYNAYRSYTYCKPDNVACGGNYSNNGFNFVLMPTRHGNLLPAVTYSKSF
jgi:hypothetical protein